MKILDSIIMSIKSLLANKMRSSLTMLGIIIGVGSVITLMAVGQGAQANITSTLEDLGTNVLYVMPTSPEAATLPETIGKRSNVPCFGWRSTR